MKQVLQNVGNGATEVVDLPRPQARQGSLVIASRYSLISSGTEKMALQSGSPNLLQKAMSHPEKVKKAIDMARTDGLQPTLEAIKGSMDIPIAMGYSNVGQVIELGHGVQNFKVGDWVVSNGPHAEIVCVPENLCAQIPEGVPLDQAAFAVLGAIALQGIRLAEPTLGESFVVTGLGVIGLLTVQLLRAQGCRVMGLDFDEQRLQLAKQFGAATLSLQRTPDPTSAVLAWTQNHGADGVIITAATSSNEPIEHAAKMSRQRGRVILTGVSQLQLDRNQFYYKELKFQVSCSYGPGRYQSNYEDKGLDYPIGFVRWTEQRNFQAVLQLLAEGKLDIQSLISHRFPFDEIKSAYELINTAKNESIGVLLEYSQKNVQQERKLVLSPTGKDWSPAACTIGMIGTGNYGTKVLLPAMAKTTAKVKTLSSSAGLSAFLAARIHGVNEISTQSEDVLKDPDINTLVVATRHDSHAHWIIKALEAGKNIFVEKPLCIHHHELVQIEKSYKNSSGHLMVGFNRRFSPHVQDLIKSFNPHAEPGQILMTINAGAIPEDHWTQDPDQGGGRLVGEGCHFLDLARFLADSPIQSVKAKTHSPQQARIKDDNFTLELHFENGWTAIIHYWSNGHRSFPKERIEVFQGGQIYKIDNFTQFKNYGTVKPAGFPSWKQDKGQQECMQQFVWSVETGNPTPIPFEQLIEVARVSLEARDQILIDGTHRTSST